MGPKFFFRQSFMTMIVASLWVCTCSQLLYAQEIPSKEVAGFEGVVLLPTSGWLTGNDRMVRLSYKEKYSGKASAELFRDETAPERPAALTRPLPLNQSGERFTLKAYVKADVSEGDTYFLVYQYKDRERLLERSSEKLLLTSDWHRYEATVDINPEATIIYVGVAFYGTGTVWVDNFEFLVDGQELKPDTTILDLDTEFASGSDLSIENSLTGQQIRNLSLLGKIWGFLKYHHPVVTKGDYHWDYELFRIMPQILAARSSRQRNKALLTWVNSLGDIPDCDPCVEAPNDVHLKARLEWISDKRMLGPELSAILEEIYHNRAGASKQFYVRQGEISKAEFINELKYPSFDIMDSGYKLLSVFRYWNIIEYWFPYRDLIDEDWDTVLAKYIPEVLEAETRDNYALVMMQMIAEITDSHAKLWSHYHLTPPKGTCGVPVEIRFIEDVPVVYGYLHDTEGSDTGLQVGDIVLRIDGQRVETLVREWRLFYGDSNLAAERRNMARRMLGGECEPVALKLKRNGKVKTLTANRVENIYDREKYPPLPHDRAGETFQILDGNIGYLKLSSVRIQDVPSYIEMARPTDGLVIDIRNYPSAPILYTFGRWLVEEKTPFTEITYPDVANPGVFYWASNALIEPREDGEIFRKPVAVLVNESSQSQAEFTAMAFRATPSGFVVGSSTAGADGNIARVDLPGGLWSWISGIGVFYPDRTPTQRIGIIPDVYVEPTIQGVIDGRDEVLETAIQEIKRRTKDKPNTE